MEKGRNVERSVSQIAKIRFLFHNIFPIPVSILNCWWSSESYPCCQKGVDQRIPLVLCALWWRREAVILFSIPWVGES